MISVKGQYVFKFDLAEKTDFLSEEDLKSFTLIEEAGNVLPSFELIFVLNDSDILKYFNEGNILKVSFGVDLENLVSSELKISHKVYARQSSSSYLIKLTGLLNKFKYLQDVKISITDKISAVEAIKKISGKYFTIDSNVDSSSDIQRWIQYSISDKQFVNEIWLHSYVKGSFLAVAIASDSSFILRDIKQLAASEYKWKFNFGEPKNTKDISFSGDYYIDSETAFSNFFAGQVKTKSVFNIDSGVIVDVTPDLNPILALSKTFDRTTDSGMRKDSISFVNENVHAKYHEAYIQNLAYLSLFSSLKTTLSFEQKYVNIKPLDLVMLRDDDIKSRQAAESYSGLYVVTKVARNISSKRFGTTVVLNREAFNSMKGKLQ